MFNAGFLPSSRNLDRFYLCRHLRLDLAKFTLSSENRRILRKGEGLRVELIPRSQFDYTPARRGFFKSYADTKFGKDVMSYDRLDALFSSPIISHLLVFTDESSGAEIGVASLYVESPALAFYYYAFYDLTHANRSLGMFMMTSAARLFAGLGFAWLYLGSCYSENALYKTQFAGMQFFTGFRWSDNLAELKFLVRRGQGGMREHLLENQDYRREFYGPELRSFSDAGGFRVDLQPEPPVF
jgi:arginyl-tRNA--protein-N-Asp/Glu arginylyltransferase